MLLNRSILSRSVLAVACLLGGLGSEPALAAYSPPSTQVDWLPAGNDAEIEQAFARARTDRKPVLVYWGAKWCPPCNQLKATLFNRQDFAERSSHFIAVHIDGDLPGAQKLGARFKVRGYPTLILFNPQGQEITRLPGEVEAPQVMRLLDMGLAGGRPVQAVLADAKAGKPLSANEWRGLAFYGWDTDEARLVPEAERAALLAQLATGAASLDPEAATRLWLKAWVARSQAGPQATAGSASGFKADAAARERLRKLLDDASASRAQLDVLVEAAPELVSALAPQVGADRVALGRSMEAALRRFQADRSLSQADQLSALMARVALARMDQPDSVLKPALPAALVNQVRTEAERLDRELTDPYERQALISSAAHLLAMTGLWPQSEALLKANLSRSHSPYYLMSQLASQARRQGRPDEALRWYAQAFETSEGPATRLQWGSSYLAALTELAPQDAGRVEAVAAQVFNEASRQEGSFHERSARSLQKVSAALLQWQSQRSAPSQATAVVRRLRTQLAPVCGRLPAADGQKAVCDQLLAG